jgi:hypothetical protein
VRGDRDADHADLAARDRPVSLHRLAGETQSGVAVGDRRAQAWKRVEGRARLYTRVARHGGRVAITLRGTSAPDFCYLTDDGVMLAEFPGTAAGRRRIRDLQAFTDIGLDGVPKDAFVAKGATAYRPIVAVVRAFPKRLVDSGLPERPDWTSVPTRRAGSEVVAPVSAANNGRNKSRRRERPP